MEYVLHRSQASRRRLRRNCLWDLTWLEQLGGFLALSCMIISLENDELNGITACKRESGEERINGPPFWVIFD
jgi:hypothetical protein